MVRHCASGRPGGGASIEAHWTARSGDGDAEPFSAAVAAYAASLAVACASKDHATGIAVREGLVTHLTSLFLRIDDGERQEGLPLDTASWAPDAPHGTVARCQATSVPLPADLRSRRSGLALEPLIPSMPAPEESSSRPKPDPVDIAAIAGAIDWDIAADALARGDLWDLPDDVADVILALAGHEDVRAAAAGLGIDGLLLAVALVAGAAADSSRQAARVRRRLLQGVDAAEFDAFARDFGGDSGPRA